MTDSINSNISLLQKIDIRNLDSCADIFADNFVFHYYNPKLTELEGDYRGLEELKSFFYTFSSSTSINFIWASATIASPTIALHRQCAVLVYDRNRSFSGRL